MKIFGYVNMYAAIVDVTLSQFSENGYNYNYKVVVNSILEDFKQIIMPIYIWVDGGENSFDNIEKFLFFGNQIPYVQKVSSYNGQYFALCTEPISQNPKQGTLSLYRIESNTFGDVFVRCYHNLVYDTKYLETSKTQFANSPYIRYATGYTGGSTSFNGMDLESLKFFVLLKNSYTTDITDFVIPQYKDAEGTSMLNKGSGLQVVAITPKTNSEYAERALMFVPTIVGLDLFKAMENEPTQKIPNEDGGISQPEGGDGDFDNTSDQIPIPLSPTFFINTIGFTKIYCPTIIQAYQLSRYMWSDDFVSNIKDLFTNPMEAIIGLYTLPYTPALDDLEYITIGNVTTTVQARPIQFTAQYTTLDFGKIYVKKFWGNYLDYSPNTKITLYLPYIGYKDIDIDKVMGKNIGVVYRCNVLDGTFIAYITSDSNVFAQYNGTMFQSLPLSNYDGSNIISSYLGIAKNVGGAVIGGISAPMTGGASLASSLSNIGGIVGNVMNAKPTINVDGSISGNAGFFGVPYPYYIITRPRQALPKQYNILHGYPSFISTKLGDLNGYTEISDIHLENMSCTDDEKNEIENLLKSGVII